MVKKQKIVVQTQSRLTSSPSEMIRLAVSGGADLDKLEKLLAIQERWEANEARKVFAHSFANVQKDIQAVLKTKINLQTHSKYADLGNVIESSKPVYTKEGFSIIFYEGDTSLPEHVRIYADVLHSVGHKETFHFDVPLDGKGIQGNANMTKIHGKASSIAYGRRYLMCMIWNIPTADDDGNIATIAEKIGDKELHSLRDQFIALDVKEGKFISYMGIEKLEDMPLSDYPKANAALEAKRTAKKPEVTK
mgnify:CR=1 FL=1